MTGWQGNDGGQGGWNPQSFGPDPGTNKYGTDPYVNQYGSDPYSDPYAQADPYAQYQQQPGYQTGGFPAQGYPPTGGFPAQGYPPPPPPKRSKLPMILSLVAIVIIIGAVVAIVLVNRKDTQTAEPQPTSTSKEEPGPSSKESTSSSEEAPPSTGGGTHDDWTTIDNTADAGLTYQVPPEWKESPVTRASGLDVDFTGDADYGVYDCGGASYVRTFAASGDVQGKDGKDLDLTATVSDFAKSFAATYYGADAKVDAPAPTETTVGGKTAMTLTATVTPNAAKPECQATAGEVGIVGVLLESDGQPNGVAMLVVVNDLEGGPDDPKSLDSSVTQEVLKTVSAG